jgi:hypothetical protein
MGGGDSESTRPTMTERVIGDQGAAAARFVEDDDQRRRGVLPCEYFRSTAAKV